MRKLCSWTLVTCGLLAVAFLVTTTARQAQARPNYLKWWEAKYPTVEKKNNVKTAVKCNVCHYGDTKKNRNDYGKAIAKALAPHKNVKAKDKQIFEDALKTAAEQKSATPDKTFGDLLQADELPGKRRSPNSLLKYGRAKLLLSRLHRFRGEIRLGGSLAPLL